MASSFLPKFLSASIHPQYRCTNQALAPVSTQFLPSTSLWNLKGQCQIPSVQLKKLHCRRSYAPLVVLASQSNIFRGCANGLTKSCDIVVQRAWKVGREGIDAAANLVPAVVPRPLAKLSVTVIAASVALFVFKSILSTVFFAVAMMGLIYLSFISLNKDEGPKGGRGLDTTSTEESLEEARRIMEKYK